MKIFAVFALSVFIIGNLYLFHSLYRRINWFKSHKLILILCAIFLIVIQLQGTRFSVNWYSAEFLEKWTVTLNYLANITFGFFSVIVILLVVIDLIEIIIKRLKIKHNQVNYNRRVMFGLGIVGGASVGSGLVFAQQLNLEKVEVPIKGLPKEFDGFKIIQISDLHIGPILRKEYAERVADLANSTAADLLALTGDMVDGQVENIGEHLMPLAAIKAKYGTYYVTGNHEFYWNGPGWIEFFANKINAKVLANQHHIIEINSQKLAIVGVHDRSTLRNGYSQAMNLDAAFAGLPNDLTKILLAHQPSTYKEAEKFNVDLQLSGHTHAGQYFPFTLLIYFFHRYVRGLNLHNEKNWIYVNSATGYWGPPMRNFKGGEVTLLTLKAI